MYNKLLQRQVQKYFGQEELQEKFAAFLKVISETYDHFEKDRNMLERSIELSSEEMIDLNNRLRNEKEDLKEIETKLEEANLELNKLFNTIDEVLFSVDMTEMKLIQMSAACEKVYGYSANDFFSDKGLWKKIILPEDSFFLEENKKLLFSGKTVNNQYRITHKNGQVRWVETTIIPTLNEHGNSIRLDGVTRDITEKRLAEESLQKSEANLRNILENTDTAYVLLDKDANILSYNQMARELAMEQLNEKLAEGKNYVDMMQSERKNEVKVLIDYVLERKEQVRYEIKYTFNGKEKWLYVRIHPIFNAAHEVLGVSVAATNITSKKIAEEQIRQSNERYKLVTKATNDIIWDWDIEGNKIFRSQNYSQVLGYSGDENNMYTDSLGNYFHPDDRARIVNSITEKINDPGSILWEAEYRYFRSNGELAYVQDRGYIIRDEYGKPLRMVGAMRDITGEKLLYIEREKITADLVQRNKDLEQFANIISHNLRAPVANLTGLINIIQHSKLAEEDFRNCMDALALSAKKLDEVIVDLNHILQVRREINEKKEIVRFSDLVNDITTSIDSLLKKENVTVITNFSDINEIFTLKSYMNSIFYNLISNSIKYRSQACPVIEISSRRIDQGVMLTFKDNGLGIDLANQGNKIFGLYKRFHFHKEGKGIGLYMVKTQVEILGGRISVKSETEKGSEFLIELVTH